MTVTLNVIYACLAISQLVAPRKVCAAPANSAAGWRGRLPNWNAISAAFRLENASDNSGTDVRNGSFEASPGQMVELAMNRLAVARCKRGRTSCA